MNPPWSVSINWLRNKSFPTVARPSRKLLRRNSRGSRKVVLAQECAKLDPAFEKALAEEGLSEDLAEWPEY